jgi:UDP-N-acetylglucosamine 2-epimerase (non-hydrolysing)
LFDPFPEEAIRRIAFRLSDVLFCPGEWARRNVDGLEKEVVDTCANTLTDSLQIARKRFLEPGARPFSSAGAFGVVSIHRTENVTTRKRLRRIVCILEEISEAYPLLMVMHKTTQRGLVRSNLMDRIEENPNIQLSPRYSYFDFVSVLDQAAFVMSDGGSNQEECAYLGKPLLLLRQRTERMEGLERNCIVSGYDRERIMAFIHNHDAYVAESDRAGAAPSCVVVDYCLPFARL